MNAPQRFDRCLLIDPTMRCDNEDAAKCCQGTADLKCPCDCHRTEKDSEIEQLEGELSRLRALNAELLAAVEQAAGECAECGATGTYQYQFPLPDGAMAKPGESCAVCADLRALVARARGEG